MTAYKHLVLNGAEIYEKSDTENMKRDADGFTRDIANMMIGTLKDISVKPQRGYLFVLLCLTIFTKKSMLCNSDFVFQKQVRDVPREHDTGY
jgi:hypothetical protein